MKCAILIPDGAADRPLASLGHRTPLEVAHTPHMDTLARDGQLGLARTVPEGMRPGSDVASLSVLGFNPALCYTGRAPLEAASLGLKLRPGQAVFRANTVTVVDGVMVDYAAGHIPNSQSHPLIESLAAALSLEGASLHPGVQYRHACILDALAGNIPDRVSPQDILGQPIADYNPTGPCGERILAVENRTRVLLPEMAINRERQRDGKPPVTQLWLWGGGTMPRLARFDTGRNLSGCMISAVDLLKGIALLSGLRVIDVPGATGYYDTDYAGKGKAALRSLQDCDLVVIHVEAPDEAGHNGDLAAKIEALESFDSQIVAPLLARACQEGDLRILCAPDHPTPVELRTHTADPVPFALWGPGIARRGGASFSETAATGCPVTDGWCLLDALASS